MKTGPVIAALLAPIAACASAPGAIPAQAQRPADSGFAARVLAAHNGERTTAGVPPLAWSAGLAQDAQAWADLLAREGRMRHATREQSGGAGENLWMGTAGRFTPEAMVGSWTGESRYFRSGVFPDVSRTGNWQDVGHYTQVVWRNTQQVGCALATGAANDFFVCRYSPAGNVQGQAPF